MFTPDSAGTIHDAERFDVPSVNYSGPGWLGGNVVGLNAEPAEVSAKTVYGQSIDVDRFGGHKRFSRYSSSRQHSTPGSPLT